MGFFQVVVVSGATKRRFVFEAEDYLDAIQVAEAHARMLTALGRVWKAEEVSLMDLEGYIVELEGCWRK